MNYVGKVLLNISTPHASVTNRKAWGSPYGSPWAISSSSAERLSTALYLAPALADANVLHVGGGHITSFSTT
eukprot:4675247-Amphidinium_carterae.2